MTSAAPFSVSPAESRASSRAVRRSGSTVTRSRPTTSTTMRASSSGSTERSDWERVTMKWSTTGASSRTMPSASLSASTPMTAVTRSNVK